MAAVSVAFLTAFGAASASASARPLTDRLLSSSVARHLGFPTVADKALSSHKTGKKDCSTGAEVVYEDVKTYAGLIDEIFTCNSVAAAKAYMAEFKGQYPPSTTLPPPKALGTNAGGSAAGAPIYAYYWTRGSYVGFVAIDTDATNVHGTAVIHNSDPLTSSLLASLNTAATTQNRQLR